jgi:hypothetical protein
LLHKDENKRLGANSGASDIKAHVAFKKINWALLRNMEPPIIPPPINPIDPNIVHHSVSESLSLDLDQEDKKKRVRNGRNPFENFSSGKY